MTTELLPPERLELTWDKNEPPVEYVRARPAATEADDPKPSWLKRQADQVEIDIQTTCPCKNRKLAPLAAADAVDAMTANELAWEVLSCSIDGGETFLEEKAAALIEAYRAATWRAGVEAAAQSIEHGVKLDGLTEGKYWLPELAAKQIRALKPPGGGE